MDYYTKILQWISRRPKTIYQVRLKLIDWGCSVGDSNILIDQLCAKGFLDDRKYVDAWVYSDCVKKGKTIKQLIVKLKPKGISSDLINDVALRYSDDINRGRLGLLSTLIRKHYRKGSSKYAMIQSCQRQGFWYRHVIEMCDSLLLYQDDIEESSGIILSPLHE